MRTEKMSHLIKLKWCYMESYGLSYLVLLYHQLSTVIWIFMNMKVCKWKGNNIREEKNRGGTARRKYG